MKYVALLRGINVGGNNHVPMSKLKTCFENSGFTNVSTYINSGNVIFDTRLKSESKMVEKIESGIIHTFGFPVRAVVRSKVNIEKVSQAIPKNWENNTEQRSEVLFLWDDYAHKKNLKLIAVTEGVDTLKYVDGAILWNFEKKHYKKSKMKNFIGTELYKNMTARNVNTVRKLVDLMQG